MAIYLNGLTIESGTTFKVSDSSNNIIFEQSAAGVVNMPRSSTGAAMVPMFNVGMSGGAWTSIATGVVQWAGAGNGYVNVNNAFNTSNGRFTAPWTGLYLFKFHIYSYGNNATIGWYYHPFFLVNGSTSARRPGGPPYKIRNYGRPANYGHDSDHCELIYLTANDYVEAYCATAGTMEGYGPYSSFSGAYLGN
jgi:hypothetical protein